MRTKYTKVKKMWADMGYQGRNLKNHIRRYDIDIEIVKAHVDLGALRYAT
ncbi:transposase, IS5 family, OrfB [Wolbachia endosymbiont of Drosophila ananassae]|nr:transposase, IS5 family, OrfB [Wolbachia endosymbiont of Drosophila ananassae]